MSTPKIRPLWWTALLPSGGHARYGALGAGWTYTVIYLGPGQGAAVVALSSGASVAHHAPGGARDGMDWCDQHHEREIRHWIAPEEVN